MQYTRETAVKKLLESYQAYFNITRYDDDPNSLVALCEFYERSEKFVLSRKAELWSANCEEFIYLFNIEHLTKASYDRCVNYAYENGMERAHIGPGHMYTYITPIFVCDSCDEDAKKALKRCHIYKSFKFSLHGWMDFHTAMYELSHNKIYTNYSGKCVEKVLKKVLFHKKGR